MRTIVLHARKSFRFERCRLTERVKVSLTMRPIPYSNDNCSGE